MVHIFLDESGSFGGVETGKSSVSVQGALAIPTKQLDGLFKRYARLRRSLPKRNGEVKGSLLSEDQVAEVVGLLHRYDALFAASLIDLGFHEKEEIERHRLIGVESLSANLTNGHTPELRASIASLQTRMRGFSIPAYAQMMITVDLLHRFLGEIINYHSQRRPRELANFHWVVDGKAADNIVTDWEKWWSDTLVVWLQARSVRDPMPLIESANFRYLEELFMRVPEYLRPFV